MRRTRTIDISSSMYNAGLGICIMGFLIALSFMMKAPLKEMTKEIPPQQQESSAEVKCLIVENNIIRKENEELLAKIAEIEAEE